MKTDIGKKIDDIFRSMPQKKLMVWTMVLTIGLLAFEAFNFRSTQYSLADFMAPLSVGPLLWSTTLALAFCAVDFAGVGRIFTAETDASKESEAVWYLFAAWAIAAIANAFFTWWGITASMLLKPDSLVLAQYPVFLKIIPIFLALLVLAIRVLLINIFASATDIALHTQEGQGTRRNSSTYSQPKPSYREISQETRKSLPTNNMAPAPRPAPAPTASASTRPLYAEPTYHNIGEETQPPQPYNGVRPTNNAKK